jgi:uncharacterized protein YbjT (DUF2867 family)
LSHRAVITGAFSYTGAAVAADLSARGWQIHSLTNRKPPEGTSISTSPLRFEPEHLRRELAGSDALVNTYWVRFPHEGQTFDSAVERSGILFDAAVAAGVKRLVHVSVSNAQEGKNLGYYRAKAEVEERVRSLSIGHAIVRPTLIVGPNDVLTNNIAWMLRRFPIFPVPGGRYRIQPVTLQDAARIIADAVEGGGNTEIDAAGPETFAFVDYVRLIARACGLRRLIFKAPAWMAVVGLKLISWLKRDVLLTREELLGLKQELLLSRNPPLGRQSVAVWLNAHGGGLGRSYANDLSRHFGAGARYAILDPEKLPDRALESRSTESE